MVLLPLLFNTAVISSPSTAHPFSPVTVTVTSLLFFSLSVNLERDTETDSASHTSGVGDTVGIGGNVGVGTGGNVGVGNGGKVGIGVSVGDGLGVGVGVATGAATIIP